MLLLYLIFVIIFIIGIRFKKDEFNKDYLNKKTTTIINGMFVITVFFNHFTSYLHKTNALDNYLIIILSLVGQLMVTSFLFYSGYGIYESIKNKEGYIKSFFKNRFIPTFINFSIAVVFFIIINLIIGKSYSVKRILLSFIGYESIGNSNWYMLATFTLYIFTMISFNKLIKIKDIYRIIILVVLTFIYIYVLSKFKGYHYVNTILCFPVGMIYSYYKDKINKLFYKKYYFGLLILILSFIGSYFLHRIIGNVYSYNLFSICFIVLLVIVTMKFEINSKIMSFFGNNVFWIYILQRIPMLLLQDKMNNYLYFICSFVITIGISYLMKKIMDKFWKLVLKKS